MILGIANGTGDCLLSVVVRWTPSTPSFSCGGQKQPIVFPYCPRFDLHYHNYYYRESFTFFSVTWLGKGLFIWPSQQQQQRSWRIAHIIGCVIVVLVATTTKYEQGAWDCPNLIECVVCLVFLNEWVTLLSTERRTGIFGNSDGPEACPASAHS